MKFFNLPINFLYSHFDANVIDRRDNLWQFWFETDYVAGVNITRKNIEKFCKNINRKVLTIDDYHCMMIAEIIIGKKFNDIELVVVHPDDETSIKTGFHTMGAYEYLGINEIPVMSNNYDIIKLMYDNK
ncbi:MAG: hypothetical protein [Caudoviricetes sp.]|nr:MAG: hypothetical protein [Caudoviricetes sp.]